MSEERDHDFYREKWEEDHCSECRERAENCTCVYPPLFSAFGFAEEDEEDEDAHKYNEECCCVECCYRRQSLAK